MFKFAHKLWERENPEGSHLLIPMAEIFFDIWI